MKTNDLFRGVLVGMAADAITLDECGRMVISDERLLEAISGGADEEFADPSMGDNGGCVPLNFFKCLDLPV